MAYQDNLAALAAEHGLMLPLTERDLDIFGIHFEGSSPLFGTSKNLGSRLFLQQMAKDSSFIPIHNDVRTQAEAFFAEHWEATTRGEVHPIINGFMESLCVALLRKSDMQVRINDAWEHRDQVTYDKYAGSELDNVISAAVMGLDLGTLRVAEKIDGEWVTNQWLKEACLLYFRLHQNAFVDGAPGLSWDKVPLKGATWSESDWEDAGFRLAPGAIVRHGAYIAPKGVVLMANSFVNMGAYVDEYTMVDTGARVGSCAQVGKNCHIGAGSGIGGVFEPLQALPTIIGDDVFMGAMCEVAEGVVVGDGCVLGMGTLITASTKIFDRETGNITKGVVPPNSVVVPGSLPAPDGGPSTHCAIIIRQADLETRKRLGINELLRD
ncbi:MAG: 2,3,4,5-tetrahydropyridine-2-carboxylate N-succinyltransferase [Parcubacteria bacterium C7867-008]|nr:MAG: 2,3,4,5-tetrahydropyridine-2-carboxylate N-succinyltransferase [Parcubacteria bacterium C7867-008]